MAVLILVTHDWFQLPVHAVIPHLQMSKSFMALLVAILGTTISPYLFF
ncbi:MAG: divalent metal cation transporter [Acidobacteria bacterium]|nr:divalent metal cation transporter [Acidobacteriota bacterium]